MPADNPPPQDIITVAIVEDQGELRESLKEVLAAAPGIRCVAACSNGEEATRDLPALRPDVVFMDINLPGMDGVACVRRLVDLMPGVLVVMLTVYDNTDAIFLSLEAGACGYLHKPVLGKDLAAAARDVVAGASPMSGKIARLVLQSFKKPPAPKPSAPPSGAPPDTELTLREQAILDLLLKGHLYKEIAGALDISTHTVHFHIRHIYQKLHVHSRAQVVARFLGSPG